MLTRLIFSVFTTIQPEELMEWHLSGVTRTRIRVIGVNFSEFLSQGKGNLILSQRGIRSIRVRFNRVKMNEKWDEFQGKLDLVRVSGEFEFSVRVRDIGVLLYK